jgi:hypothetical protein
LGPRRALRHGRAGVNAMASRQGKPCPRDRELPDSLPQGENHLAVRRARSCHRAMAGSPSGADDGWRDPEC